MEGLRIACLGWGSLLWDPRTLPMEDRFRLDGPWLPIEFSRVSLDGRVTLVIDPDAPHIQTYSVRLSVGTLDAAIEGLGIREKIVEARWPEWIGVQTRDHPHRDSGEAEPGIRDAIASWLADQRLDAVVWTALPARGPDGRLGIPSVETLLAHLAGLEGSARERAEEYIRRAPSATRTPRRDLFEAEFGWGSQPDRGARATRTDE